MLSSFYAAHRAAHRAAQRAAADGLHPVVSAPSPSAHRVDQDLARHDYVGAIQAMDRDPDAHERQRLAATITSHLDAYLGGLSMYDLLRTLHNLDAHGCLGQIQAPLLTGATGLTQERLAFAGAVLDFGIDALEGPRPRYLSDHAADYEGAVTYLQLSAHPTPTRSAQRVAQDLAAGDVVGAFQVLDKDADRTERLYLLEMILQRLADWLGGQRGMYELLRALGPLKAQGYLDRRTERGDTVQALLLNAAHGLGKDRLAFALTVLARGAEFVNDETQPSYIAQHYEDLHGAQAYLKSTSTSTGASVVPDEPLAPHEYIYSDWLEGVNNSYSQYVEQGIVNAVNAVGYDPVLYDAWWTDVIGLTIAGAGCLVPELAAPLAISATAVGSALQGLSSLPSGPQLTFAQKFASNVGSEADHNKDTSWLHILNRIRDIVHKQHQVAMQNHWGHYQLHANLLLQFWRPEFVQVLGGGLATLNSEAIKAKTVRDLLLAGVDKKGVGGHLVYEYTATNVFRTENLAGMAGAVYNRPKEWHYTPGRVVLAVAPQLVAALTDQQTTQPILSSDVTAPATIVITTPSIVGSTDFRASLQLDDKDNVTGLSPRPEYWWDGQGAERVEAPEGEWAQAMRASAWRASGAGARPQVPVSAVAQESWNL